MSTPSALFERTRAALRELGFETEGNPELGSFRLFEDDVTTVVMALDGFDAVGCYTVWPQLLPVEHLDALRALVCRVNSELYTVTLELDETDATLSARATVPCARLGDVDDDVFTGMVQDAITDSRTTLADQVPAVQALLGQD